MSDPRFVYDDDCGFCTWWAEFFATRADLTVVGFSELDAALRERLPEDYETCSHLVTDGGVHSCGASIERALLRTDLGVVARPIVERLRRLGRYSDVREWGYRRGANNRDVWGRLLSESPPATGTDTSESGDS